jgi:hypothetical protein
MTLLIAKLVIDGSLLCYSGCLKPRGSSRRTRSGYSRTASCGLPTSLDQKNRALGGRDPQLVACRGRRLNPLRGNKWSPRRVLNGAIESGWMHDSGDNYLDSHRPHYINSYLLYILLQPYHVYRKAQEAINILYAHHHYTTLCPDLGKKRRL